LVEGTLALNAPFEVWEAFENERVAMTAEAIAGWADEYPDVEIQPTVLRSSRRRPGEGLRRPPTSSWWEAAATAASWACSWAR
jgi:hypothetical protein